VVGWLIRTRVGRVIKVSDATLLLVSAPNAGQISFMVRVWQQNRNKDMDSVPTLS